MLRMTPPEAGGWASITSTAFHEASTVPRRSTASNRSSFSVRDKRAASPVRRSEEHTSELQSRLHLVCRLLLEKKKNRRASHTYRSMPIRRLFAGGSDPV